MNEQNLIELMREGGNVTFTIKADEMKKVIDYCVDKTRQELELFLTEQATETYLSIKQVAEMLQVNKATLWRWAKLNILVPTTVGGVRRYKMSDVKRFLENRQDSHE
jgi:excisionase family DNA binding protein